MPPYLYALVGALVFAIAHGMHFTVSPLPQETGTYVRQIAHANSQNEEAPGWTHPDIRVAGIGY